MSFKLLIVDDQAAIRMLLEEVFSEEGYELFFAGNGLEAMEIVTLRSPNLVLLDMKIPGMDGLEILRKIKEVQPHIDVYMMTAYGELSMIEEAKQLGALKFLTKPFDIDDLRSEVKGYVNTIFHRRIEC